VQKSLKKPLKNEIVLRVLVQNDLRVSFEYQCDPEACKMAIIHIWKWYSLF